MLKLPHTLVQGALCAHAQRQYGQLLLQLYFIYFDIDFSHAYFLLSSSLSQTNIMLRPSRIRHNRDTGADVQQGPISRTLFRLRPCVNLFYCLLLLHILRILSITESDADVIGISPRQNDARTWTVRDHHQGRYSARHLL